jgi:hypothetical protein
MEITLPTVQEAEARRTSADLPMALQTAWWSPVAVGEATVTGEPEEETAGILRERSDYLVPAVRALAGAVRPVQEALLGLFQVPPEHSASALPRKKYTAPVVVAGITEVAAHMTALEAGARATPVERFFPPAQG